MVEVKVLNKKKNGLLGRDEAECIVNFEQGTPKKDELLKAIATALTASPDLTYINRFQVKAGAKQGTASVYVYDSKEAMGKLVKEKPKEEKKA